MIACRDSDPLSLSDRTPRVLITTRKDLRYSLTVQEIDTQMQSKFLGPGGLSLIAIRLVQLLRNVLPRFSLDQQIDRYVPSFENSSFVLWISFMG